MCIQSERDGQAVAVDVALPSSAPVGGLLPAIVDMVDGLAPTGGAVFGWRLDRASGGALVDSLSLNDNGVRDGELLILTGEFAPPLGRIRVDPCRRVGVEPTPSVDAARFLPEASCLLAVGTAAAALGASPSTTSLVVAAGGTCAAAAAAIAKGRSATLSLAAVLLASTTGYLVVPSGPSAANVFLAAVACLSASLVMLRLVGRPSSTLAAAAALSSVCAISSVASLPVAAAGAAMSTASLVLLALAPRITVLACRLGPDHWADDDVPADAGHRVLTGLVAGSATGAAIGATLVAAAGIAHHATESGAIVFSALIGAVLLLRARTYVDAARRVFLAAGGLVGGVVCFGVGVHARPEYLGWSSAALLTIGVGVAWRPRVGDAVSRLADRFEYVALAAMVPAACWVSGVYTLVQQAHLP